MTMRDQILTGIRNASATADPMRHTIDTLTEADADLLAEHILAALAQTPEDTPAPTVTVPPALPTLVLSPADVIAHAAQEALTEVREDEDLAVNPDALALVTMEAGGEDYREFREFLFAIQALFGIRMRSTRRVDEWAWYKIAGYPAQIEAFKRTMWMIRDLAAPVVTTLDRDERREFWATLGTLCASTDTAERLIEANAQTYTEATAYLTDLLGPARTLPRATPATEGSIYEQAAAVAAVTEIQS